MVGKFRTMTSILAALSALFSMLVGGVSTQGATVPGGPSTYFVDFAAGSDTNVGNRADSPWQHAPGDRLATGRAATAKLVAGDIVRFRGGVAYRGLIRAVWSGTPGKPIAYRGTGYGSGAAIIDGGDPVSLWTKMTEDIQAAIAE